MRKKLYILAVFGIVIFGLVMFGLSKTPKSIEVGNDIKQEAVKIESPIYLADDEAFWQMIKDNYGIVKNQDRYETLKELEDAERKLEITNCELVGIGIIESKLDQFASGDSGCSAGLFQINRCVHLEVSKRTAFNVGEAAQWTLDNLKVNGYPENKVLAIAKHNGSINNVKVQQYAFRVLLGAERACSLR